MMKSIGRKRSSSGKNSLTGSFKILRNLTLRRQHETKEHQNLLERKVKLENIKANIDEDDTLDEEAREQQVGD